MKLTYVGPALRRLKDLRPAERVSMIERLEAIAADPFAHHANVTAMKGETDRFRLRQGGWRAVYSVDREGAEPTVLLIEPRGKVYR